MSTLFNPAGGLGHHWHAVRHRNLWRSHRDHTFNWLKTWQPKAKRLVLVGPSAGYSLAPEFLADFDQVVALEPDSLGRFLLLQRFSRMPMEPLAQDYLCDEHGALWPEGLLLLLEDFPDSAFLFCNVLGQLPLIARDFLRRRETWLSHFLLFQEQSTWASYHDVWSAPGRTQTQQVLLTSQRQEQLLQESARFFLPEPRPWIRDHETQGLFREDCERVLWAWQRTPNQVHCIEGVRPSKQPMGA